MGRHRASEPGKMSNVFPTWTWGGERKNKPQKMNVPLVLRTIPVASRNPSGQESGPVIFRSLKPRTRVVGEAGNLPPGRAQALNRRAASPCERLPWSWQQVTGASDGSQVMLAFFLSKELRDQSWQIEQCPEGVRKLF